MALYNDLVFKARKKSGLWSITISIIFSALPETPCALLLGTFEKPSSGKRQKKLSTLQILGIASTFGLPTLPEW